MTINILKNQLFYKDKNKLYRETEKNSIVFQLQNLLSYPIVKKR